MPKDHTEEAKVFATRLAINIMRIVASMETDNPENLFDDFTKEASKHVKVLMDAVGNSSGMNSLQRISVYNLGVALVGTMVEINKPVIDPTLN